MMLNEIVRDMPWKVPKDTYGVEKNGIAWRLAACGNLAGTFYVLQCYWNLDLPSFSPCDLSERRRDGDMESCPAAMLVKNCHQMPKKEACARPTIVHKVKEATVVEDAGLESFESAGWHDAQKSSKMRPRRGIGSHVRRSNATSNQVRLPLHHALASGSLRCATEIDSR